MRILVLSSQARNTGSNLRAYYVYKHLKARDTAADYVEPPFNSMPFMLDFLLSMFYYFFMLMNRKYDYVFVVKPYPNTVIPALMLKAQGARLIIDIEDLDYGYRGGALSAVISSMQRSLVKYADSLTSHNAELIKLVKKEHPEYDGKIYMLKQAVDMSLFSAGPETRKKAAAYRAAHKGKKILFYMAHLNIACYLEDIFRSLAYIRDPSVILVVAGGGPMTGYYKNMAAKMGLSGRVEFTGAIKQQEAAAMAYASDACLVYYKDVPVNRYRASMKLREYLALGKKTVATLVGEIRIFKDYIYGCRPDPGSFATASMKAIKTLDKKAKKGYKFIKDNFNWKNEARSFYKYLLDGLK